MSEDWDFPNPTRELEREREARELAEKMLEKEIQQIWNEVNYVKLGKSMRLEYIRFSDLIEPKRLTSFSDETIDSIPFINSRPLGTMKHTDIRALEYSIRWFLLYLDIGKQVSSKRIQELP